MNIKKIVRLGTAKTWGGRSYSIFCKVSYTDERGLSIKGVEGPLPSGNCLGACGQICMDPTPLTRYAPGWTPDKVTRFFEMWENWHLKTDVPAPVLDELRALPDTDRQPAWV